MALDLTPDQRELGKANFRDVSGELTRRGFMKSMVAAGGAVAVAGAAGYFGYQKMDGKPVKAAVIGTGDEGGVLIGDHNPEFNEFVAVCDIRPTNLKRIFEGEPNVNPGYMDLRNVVMTPHIGSASCATRIVMCNTAAANMTAVLEGRDPPNPVN